MERRARWHLRDCADQAHGRVLPVIIENHEVLPKIVEKHSKHPSGLHHDELDTQLVAYVIHLNTLSEGRVSADHQLRRETILVQGPFWLAGCNRKVMA